MLPLVLPVVQLVLQFGLCCKPPFEVLAAFFPPHLSSCKTPKEFVMVLFAERVKLAGALCILLMRWLKKLNQQKTINSFSVGFLFC